MLIKDLLINMCTEKVKVGTIPYVEIGDINIITKKYILKEKGSVWGAKFAYKNSILISTVRPTRGAITIVEEEKIAVSSAFAILNVNEKICNYKYLFYYLNKKDFYEYLGSKSKGATYPTCSKDDINNYEIELPSLEIQNKVVRLFDKINESINIKSKQLNSFNDLIKSQFVEMFENSESVVEKLGNVCIKITDGTHKTPNYIREGIKFISAKNIVNEKLNFSDVKYISCKEYKEIQNRCNTEKGDILLSKSGSLGVPVVLDTDIPIGLFESLAVIKFNRNKLNGIFLCEQLKSEKVQKQFKSESKGISIKHLHLNVLKNIDIFIPSLELQNKFANFVEQIDKQKFVIANIVQLLAKNSNYMIK